MSTRVTSSKSSHICSSNSPGVSVPLGLYFPDQDNVTAFESAHCVFVAPSTGTGIQEHQAVGVDVFFNCVYTRQRFHHSVRRLDVRDVYSVSVQCEI